MKNQTLLAELKQLGHQAVGVFPITGEILLLGHHLVVTESSLIVCDADWNRLDTIEMEWRMPHPWSIVGTTPEGYTYAFLENGELCNSLQFLCGVRDNATHAA